MEQIERRVGGRRATDRCDTHMHKAVRGAFLVAGLLIIAVYCGYCTWAYPNYEESRIREKALERQQEVNLLSGIADLLVEHDGSVEGLTYKDILLYSLKYMDEAFTSTFAQLYAIDESAKPPLVPLMELSQGVGGGQKHNPLDYPEFVNAVTTTEFGSLTYWYETPEAGGRDVYMTYRWVPTDTSRTSRLLIAVAISKYSVSEQMATRIKIVSYAMTVITSIYIIAASFITLRRGLI